ncbi:hypothetical protein LCGC14_2620800 [marine sediment metagenome]|uniref:Uncharacterized protein n=1 Tax=marine sediment metagenome TaxID=412755 RepID=A0A0F9AQQ5_9ZZZZ
MDCLEAVKLVKASANQTGGHFAMAFKVTKVKGEEAEYTAIEPKG